MNFYTIISKFYDILDVTYFADRRKNPRIAISDMIHGNDLKILDMCCGTFSNSILTALKHKNANIFGIDISPQMLKKARQKIRLNGIENVCLKCSDATATQLSGEYFDYIIIGLALHEMNPTLQNNILKESHRLLKNNGRLIVLEWERPENFLQRIFFFPLLIAEQILNPHFLEFYHCNKKIFFKDNEFEICRRKHCSYSCVYELKKFRHKNI